MKLKEFAKQINKCVKYAKKTNPNIQFFKEVEDDKGNFETVFFKISRIGQFEIIPDVSVELEEDNE